MNTSLLVVVVALFVFGCSSGVLAGVGCTFPVTDWNLQGNPQPCSCSAKVFLLSENAITVSFKTRVFATKVKVFFAPDNSYYTTTTRPTSTFSTSFSSSTPFTGTGSVSTSVSTSSTFSNVFGRGSSGYFQVKLIGSNDEAVIFDSSELTSDIFDGDGYECYVLTITPPALPYRVQKIELINTSSNDLIVRGVKLFGLTDQPAPSTQQPGYVAAADGSLYR